MKRKIITNRKELKRISDPVNSPEEIESLIKELEENLDTSKGVGLSAIQIGLPKQVAIIRTPYFRLDLINPRIIEKSDKFRHKKEGCLSFPGLRIDTARWKNITIENYGKIETYTDYFAVIIQHEIAHIKGRTIIDDKWRRK